MLANLEQSGTKSGTSTYFAIYLSTNFSYNLLILWCPEGDLNPHDRLRSADFKSAVSADFTIRATLPNFNPYNNLLNSTSHLIILHFCAGVSSGVS